MKLEESISLQDVLLVPRYTGLSSRSECNFGVDIYRNPLISSPMDTVYSKELDEYLTSNQMICVVHRYFKSALEQLEAARCKFSTDYRYFAVGKDEAWIKCLFDHGVKHFCVDMAHGDSRICVDTILYIKGLSVTNKVMAGNVATRSGFKRLEEAGADMIRVGIGSGSICATRTNTGFGVPLLSSIMNCATIRKKALIIADGGMKDGGDIAKAMKFGADMVMLGKQFAATDLGCGACYDEQKEFECSYENIHNACRDTSVPHACFVKYKRYRGMASAEARKGVLKKASVEGVSGLIPYTGTTKDFVEQLEANFQASLSYGGVTNWDDFRRNVKVVRITNAGWTESLTHVIGE